MVKTPAWLVHFIVGNVGCVSIFMIKAKQQRPYLIIKKNLFELSGILVQKSHLN